MSKTKPETEDLHHTLHIAGVKFRPDADKILAGLEHGSALSLEPDPENKFDPHAVKVMCGDHHVGFIPASMSKEVGKLIKDGRFLRCTKRTGHAIHVYFSKQD